MLLNLAAARMEEEETQPTEQPSPSAQQRPTERPQLPQSAQQPEVSIAKNIVPFDGTPGGIAQLINAESKASIAAQGGFQNLLKHLLGLHNEEDAPTSHTKYPDTSETHFPEPSAPTTSPQATELTQLRAELDRLKVRQQQTVELFDKTYAELNDLKTQQQSAIAYQSKEERDHFLKLRFESCRRLQKLELSQARTGYDTPPQILMEIEDIGKVIKEIDAQLSNWGSPSPSHVSTERAQILITIDGDFDQLTDAQKRALGGMAAALANVPPEYVKVNNIFAGSIVLEIEMPQPAAAWLTALHLEQHPALQAEHITSVNPFAVSKHATFTREVKRARAELNAPVTPRSETQRLIERALLATDDPEQKRIILRCLAALTQTRPADNE